MSFKAGFVIQLREFRRSMASILALFTAPLMTLVFLAIATNAGREDLTSYAVLAPSFIAMWTMALLTAGELVSGERDNGSLEALVSAPTSFVWVIFGRIVAVTFISLFGFVESWLIAWSAFGILVPIFHPIPFVLTLLFTSIAMAGTASMMSAIFVLARSARIFQNSLSYPFYVLGGVMVPVTFLPEWLQPFTRVIFLSWSSDLMRDTLKLDSIPDLVLRLTAIASLGIIGLWAGSRLLQASIHRVRKTGSINYA